MQRKSRVPIRYQFSEIEVTQPLRALEFAAGETGAGLLLRRRGRPIGFLMRKNEGKVRWRPEELSLWIGHELKTKIVEEALGEELGLPRSNAALPVTLGRDLHSSSRRRSRSLSALGSPATASTWLRNSGR